MTHCLCADNKKILCPEAAKIAIAWQNAVKQQDHKLKRQKSCEWHEHMDQANRIPSWSFPRMDVDYTVLLDEGNP